MTLALERSLEKGRQLVQMFDHPSQLLGFIAQPGADQCIASDRWQPWLMLPMEQAHHAQQWCLEHHPQLWPWSLGAVDFEPKRMMDAALQLASDLRVMLHQRCDTYNQHLETSAYTDRPTAQQILGAGNRPLRVLTFAFAGSSYQKYCGRDMTEALQDHGVVATFVEFHQADVLDYELLEQIDKHDPDVLMLNGRGRYNFHGLPQELGVLTWDQDYAQSPDPAYVKAVRQRDRLMVLVRDWLVDAGWGQMPPHHCWHLNLGTNLCIYHPAIAKVEPEYDLLFVGHVHPWEKY